jgi:hypothetical protein
MGRRSRGCDENFQRKGAEKQMQKRKAESGKQEWRVIVSRFPLSEFRFSSLFRALALKRIYDSGQI